MKLILSIALSCMLSAHTWAATNDPVSAKKLVGTDLFGDPIIAKGKGVEIKTSQVDEAYIAFKANRAAAGQPVPEAMIPKLKEQILDKLISTQLCLNRATAADKAAGAEIANKFVADLQSKASSEVAFRRQLIAEGTTLEQFKAQVLEQGIVKAVVDREVRGTQNVTQQDLRKFYDDNPDKFMQPEQVKIAHVLLSIKNLESGATISADQQAAKKQKIQEVLRKARAGEDYAKLIKDYSEDVKQPGGEYTFARGQMPPELEAAAWTMKPGQISDVVTTIYGFHVVKLLEKIPPKKIELDKVQDKVKEGLVQDAVQKALPEYIKKLAKEANIQVTTPD